MPGTAGLYFRGLTQSQTNALRARLNDLAGDLDYIARSGPTTGENRGVLAHLLVGIDAGEVVVVRLTDEQRTKAFAHTLNIDQEWADAISSALYAAMGREAEVE